ncbi:hypothetical protein [Nocardiopsis protaetiae]|uniref:hypothetical protein n=1 Tax=Nocardiopsis protaetiae TaxID=3382270 RepID=UPI00387B83B8
MSAVCEETELYRHETGLALGVSPIPRPREPARRTGAPPRPRDGAGAPPREDTDDAQGRTGRTA